jgi:23S rRNA (pseudouridine1915-N3)-methyltransferase
MARITICAIHKISDNSLEAKFISDYLKRIPWKINIKQLEIKDKLPQEKQKACEGELLLKAIPSGDFIIVLDETGVQYSSQEFASIIEKITQPISFVIGGAYGLSKEVKNKANILLSLSNMTMPHILARLILVEQIYRSYTISQKHPYHK